MLEIIKRKITSINSNVILAAIFMVFCIYVGLAEFPLFLTNTGAALMDEIGLEEYIETIDNQYYEMLNTELETPQLQNRATYINFNGFMANLMNQPEINELIKLKNGYLYWNSDERYTKSELDAVAANLHTLAEQQRQQGKHFLFVLAPSKSYQHEIYYPDGYSIVVDEDMAYFRSQLNQQDVSYLDLGEKMEAEGIPFEEAFYKTDHHWTSQIGFWAYGKILAALEENGAIAEVDSFYTDSRNYQFDLYEDCFLGSMGRRCGIHYAGVDDFYMITPKYPTDISVEIPGYNVDLTGPFETVAYDGWSTGALYDKDYFNDNPYGLYGWSDKPLTNWSNANAPEKKNVMLIGDSFGNVPFAFMSLYFHSCKELDMRHFTGSFASTYEDYAPDVIILVANIDSLTSENATYPFFAE